MKKIKELFTRVRHKRFGEGFVFAFGHKHIGVKFDKHSIDLGALLSDFIVRGYPTKNSSEWFHQDDLEIIYDFNYEDFLEIKS